MSKEATFSLRYTHSAPDQIEAAELIKVLAAFNSIVVKANRTFYGTDANTSFRLRHVQPGSIDIQGFIEVAAGLQPAFAMLPSLSFGIDDIPGLIKSWFDLLKHLKGSAPKRVQTVKEGNAVQVENVDGNMMVVNGNVYHGCIINNVGSDAAKLEAPVRKGARQLELVRGRKKIGTYTPDDVAQFRSIKPTERPIESEIEAIVEVVAPVLQGEGMWRFKYGRMPLTAKLLDEEFRQRVSNKEESFRRGDLLRARLKTVQERGPAGKVVTRHFIVKVLGRVVRDASAA
jgi:hypothetical protein